MNVIWDAHACPTLEVGCDLSMLQEYRRLGYHYVSLNAGFDPQSAGHILGLVQYYNEYIQQHADYLMLAKSPKDIQLAKETNKLAIGFDIEGLSAFADDPAMAQRLKTLGVNQVTLAYNQNNKLAGGCQGSPQGLTKLGLKWIAALNRAGIIIDCSHMSKQSSLDAIEASSQPVVFSHSNPSALHQHERNIDDEQIKACAAKGGVIGVNGISLFLKDESIAAKNIAQHMDYIVRLVGVDHVGLGSDFVFEHEKTLALIVQFPQDFPNAQQYLRVKVAKPGVLFELKNELIKRDYNHVMLETIMGGNFFRIATEVWS